VVAVSLGSLEVVAACSETLAVLSFSKLCFVFSCLQSSSLSSKLAFSFPLFPSFFDSSNFHRTPAPPTIIISDYSRHEIQNSFDYFHPSTANDRSSSSSSIITAAALFCSFSASILLPPSPFYRSRLHQPTILLASCHPTNNKRQ